MDMGLIDVGTDNKSVIFLGEAAGQLTAQAVRFFGCDLTGDEGLAYLIGYHIVRAPPSAGLGGVELFGKKKLRIGTPAGRKCVS